MIGIVTPYNLGETTAAALRLADFIAARDDVMVFGVPPLAPRVHPFWDQHRRSLLNTDYMASLLSCRVLVHFGIYRPILGIIISVKPEIRHILVPLWHQLQANAAPVDLANFDVVVSPTTACNRQIESVLKRQEIEIERYTWCRWDAGVVDVRRPPNKPRQLGVVTGGLAVRKGGPLLLDVLTRLSRQFDNVSIEVLSLTSWPHALRRQLKQLASPSFRVMPFPGWEQLATRFHEWDWCFDARLRSQFGYLAQRSLAAGCPVVAWGTSPWDEIISPRKNGVFIPCEHFDSPEYLAPTAIARADVTYEVLADCLRDDDAYLRILKTANYGERKTAAFESYWSGCLKLC